MMAKKSLSRKYKAAVIGCGRIGALAELDPKKPKPATHAGAFLKHPRIELVGLVETDSNRRKAVQKIFPKIPVFADARELFQAVQPDIVSVATPDETHWPMVKLAAEKGVKLIICEKPIATTLNDARKIIDVCRKNKVILLVDHMRRFDPLLRKFRDQIAAGKFGDIHQIRCLYVNGLMNNGTHAIDLIRWYCGDVKSVMGRKNPQHSFTHKGDFNLDGLLELKNGARVSLQSLEKNDYYIFDLEFYGSKGAMAIRDLGFTVEVVPVLQSRFLEGSKELAFNKRKSIVASRSFFAAMADHSVACLDGEAKPASTGEDGLAALEVLMALRKS